MVAPNALKEWLDEETWGEPPHESRQDAIPDRSYHSKPELPRLTPPRSRPEAQTELKQTLGDIMRLFGEYKHGDSVVPTLETLIYAASWVSQFYNEIARSRTRWVAPHVVTNPDGEVVFTWWQGLRMLTIYIEGATAEYLESWGTGIFSEMADGNADAAPTYRALWSRLMRG